MPRLSSVISLLRSAVRYDTWRLQGTAWVQPAHLVAQLLWKGRLQPHSRWREWGPLHCGD